MKLFVMLKASKKSKQNCGIEMKNFDVTKFGGLIYTVDEKRNVCNYQRIV